MAPPTRGQALDFRDGTSFTLSEIHRILYHLMRSETWGVENTTICTICKQTLNLKVQKDIISYRERAGTLTAQAYSVKREGETNIVKILGPSSDDLLRMRKAENETRGWGGGGNGNEALLSVDDYV